MTSRREIAYHLYFTTYGTWLHGDARNSWDRHEHVQKPPDPVLEEHRRHQLKHQPTLLSDEMRRVVDAALREVGDFRGWHTHALNVRTNHVHAAVAAVDEPSKMLHDFKAYATRRLRKAGLVTPTTKVWTRKGGVKGVYHPEGLADLINYIVHGQ
ncbi:MAG: transposase [Planctomycetes bacterium]|nr:transposase [Planctomycetota bacterium]